MGQFDLSLLGGFKVTLDDRLLPDFASDKVCALLVYLALEPQPHPRSRVAALFWPETAEAIALTNLRQTTHRLRQSLERAERGSSDWLLVSTRQMLYINPDARNTGTHNAGALTIDVNYFEWLLAQCETHAHAALATCSECLPRLTEAANLYHGELLAGFGRVDAPAFEEWLLLRREYLQERAVQLFHTLTVAHEVHGADEQAQHWATRQLTLNPFRESAYRQLMRSLVRRGQRLAALSEFDRCRHLLHNELGVEPSAETLALYEEIREGRFAAKQPTREKLPSEAGAEVELSAARHQPSPPQRYARQALHNLPVELAPLIGRQPLLAELHARVQQPDTRLLTLVGTGGMGKTRLAVALVQMIVELSVVDLGAARLDASPDLASPAPPQFPDGVYFVSLASLASPTALASAIATELGLDLLGSDPQHALQQALRHRRLLLILDNFEHLLEGAGLVADLLKAAPGVQIITTSRERLNLRGEQLYHVPPLDFAPDATGETATASIQLFVQRAQRAQPNFEINRANQAVIARICQLVQGMPLALELAAAHVGALPLPAIAAEIEQNAEFLAVDWCDVPARHRSMSALFAWSWQLLSGSERRVLCQLSVFRGGFTPEAAQTVAGAELSLLMRLVNKSLLHLQETASASGRYIMHELLRQFAAEHLDAEHLDAEHLDAEQLDASERAAVEARHSRFYLAYLATRGPRLGRREPRQASEEIQAELDNIRQAWGWAAAHAQVAELAHAAYAWWQFCLFRGLEAEGRQTFALAVESLERQPPVQRDEQAGLSKLLAIRANYLAGQGHEEQMAALARQAIALGASSGGVEGETFGHFVLGRARQEMQQIKEAATTWQHTIQLARAYQIDRPDGEILREAEWMAHVWLRGALGFFADFPGGLASLAQALHICQSLGKRRGELYCLSDRAWHNLYMGDFVAAKQDFARVLHLARELGYHWMEMPAHHGLGEVMRQRGEYSQAQLLLEKAAMLADELGQQHAQARIWTGLMCLHLFAGNQEAAHDWQQQLFQLQLSVLLPKDCQIQILLASALLAHYAGDQTSAATYAEEAHQLVLAGEIFNFRADIMLILGHAQAGMGQWEAAAAAYEESIRCYLRVDNAALVVEPQAGLAQIALTQGDRAEALRLVEQILPVLAEHPHGGVNPPFFTWLTCYRVLATTQDPRAPDLLQSAHDLLQQYASSLQDAMQRSLFMDEVAIHRALHQAYVAAQKGRE